MLEVVNRILSEEGGVKDVRDGKGLTRWGQTPDWLKKWDLPTPQTQEQARENYMLWLVRTGLSHLCSVNDLLSFAVVDWAVHSGERTAIKALQRSVKVGADGRYGPRTQTAVDQVRHRYQLASIILDARMVFVGKVVRDRPSDAQYIHGWLARLGRQVKELGNATVEGTV